MNESGFSSQASADLLRFANESACTVLSLAFVHKTVAVAAKEVPTSAVEDGNAATTVVSIDDTWA